MEVHVNIDSEESPSDYNPLFFSKIYNQYDTYVPFSLSTLGYGDARQQWQQSARVTQYRQINFHQCTSASTALPILISAAIYIVYRIHISHLFPLHLICFINVVQRQYKNVG